MLPNGWYYRQGGELAEKTQITDSAFGAAFARARTKRPTCLVHAVLACFWIAKVL